MRHIVSSLSLLSCAVLTACGGGGGGGSSTPTVAQLPLITLSSGNYQTAASGSVDGTRSVTSSAQYSAMLTGADSSTSPNWTGFSLQQIGRLPALFAAGGATLQGVTYAPQTQFCDNGSSGTATITITDQNGNRNLDAGDSARVIVSNCLDAATGTITSGTMTFVVNTQPTGDLNTTIYGLDVSLGFSNVSISSSSFTATANGALRVATSRTALSRGTDAISTDGFVVSASAGGQSGAITITEFSATETYGTTGISSTLNGVIGSTASGGAIRIRTTLPLQQNYGSLAPYAGQIVMTGTSSAQAVLNVNDQNSVTVSFDANGDGTPEEQQTLTWSAL